MLQSEEQLQKVQQTGLEIFKEYIKACEKLGLRYYILYGTLLGAVRHKGFIPWDDDIDVGMYRDEYEIFLKEGAKLLPPHLFVQTYMTDREYQSNAAKIRNSNTTFIEKLVRHSDINHGIYIDIFPLDHYPDNRITEKCFNLIKKILSVRIIMAYDNDIQDNLFKKVCRGILCIVFPTLYSAVNTREKLYMSCPAGSRVINHSGAWGQKEIIPVKWYAERCMLEFEGMKVSAPKEYGKWLTHVYGDYMKLPPEEQRVPRHSTVMIDVDKPYTAYSNLWTRRRK